jgi:hypothetical protein
MTGIDRHTEIVLPHDQLFMAIFYESGLCPLLMRL